MNQLKIWLTNQLHVSFPIWQIDYAEDKVSVIHIEKTQNS